MVGDESFRGRKHPLVGRDEASAGLLSVIECPEDGIADETEERIDGLLCDIAHGRVGGGRQREELGERESGIQQGQASTHRVRIGCRVAGDAFVIDVVGEQEACTLDRLKERDAATNLRSERREVERCVPVVRLGLDGSGKDRVSTLERVPRLIHGGRVGRRRSVACLG